MKNGQMMDGQMMDDMKDGKQQLRALAAFVKDLGSDPRTHTVTHNHLIICNSSSKGPNICINIYIFKRESEEHLKHRCK